MKMGTDQFVELVSAVVRAVPRDMDTTLAQAWILDQDGLKAVLRTAMMKLPEATKPEEKPVRLPHPSDAIAARYGYTVVEDIGPTAFDISKLKPRVFLRGREQSIKGDEVRKRAIDLKGNLSLMDGQRVVDEQDQNPMPKEFEGFYVPLTGTLLRDSGFGLYLAYLGFFGSRWCLGFVRLDDVWFDDDRLACSE